MVILKAKFSSNLTISYYIECLCKNLYLILIITLTCITVLQMTVVEAPSPALSEGYMVTGMKSVHIPMSIHTTSLKRSKSLGAADMAARSGLGVTKEASEIAIFPLEVQAIVGRAVEGKSLIVLSLSYDIY